MDHEVEDDVDVEGARGEDRKPVSFEKHGTAKERRECLHSGVEALEVADHEGALVFVGKAEEVVGLGESGCDGLLDQDVDTGDKELGGDGVVGGSGNADAGGVDAEGAAGDGGEQGGDGGEYRYGVGSGCLAEGVNGVGSACGRGTRFGFGVHGNAGCGESGERGRVGVDDGGKADRGAGESEFAVDADVVTAESTRAAYGDVRVHSETQTAARAVAWGVWGSRV